ncbi:MAG: excinuclease ABC subunit UvrC [Rhodobacteraceae bacterium]|nr:excinuclease ABC subunit UvrC [Paracoccaceae bacterium]
MIETEKTFEALEEEGAVYQHGDEAAPTGPTVIQGYLPTLPDAPGVYRMLDAKGEVLYVGKARSLKKRVANYANISGHTNRILRMIIATASMVFVTTETETEALLLEANLIKQLKPRFNVLLRDDKSFPYIVIKSGAYPQISKHRGAKSDKGAYFGPFASAGAVNRTINQLQKAFLLRGCSDSMFQNRSRPCLDYQIKRCAGPCVGLVTEEQYGKLVSDASAFLSGKSTSVQSDLAAQMQEASETLEFERAAAIRDRIRALTQVQAHQGVNPQGVTDADVIALHNASGQTCIQVFFFRAGQNWGNRAYFPRTVRDCEDEEIVEAFLGQFYSDKTPPRLLLMSHTATNSELIAEALSTIAGRRVEISVPQRGEKRSLVEHALTNAREALARKVSESATQAKLLGGVAEAFGLEGTPQRIEVYDNSHIQGTNAVGGMIVAGPEGFIKSQYRKFNIKNADLTPGDDFGMMREVLNRRFNRLLKEDPGREGEMWPDLVLIDGGAGQLTAAVEALGELGLQDVRLVSVAKGEERDAGREEFHAPGRRPFSLPFRDPTLYFLQRLRDEAHRFAIGAHRQKRAKATSSTPLDEVPGVGAARKRALLTHFGSAKAVTRAGLTDLEAVDGVSKALAKKIYDFFHGGGRDDPAPQR